MEKKHATAFIALDLSAAFDTVDHDILLSVLQKSFGVVDDALNWMKSYLTNRSCYVQVDN